MRRRATAALALALVAGPAAAGGLAYLAAVAELDRRLGFRPPLAVLDYQPIAHGLATGVAAGALEPAFAELKDRGRRLRERGYLVLNKAAVEAVPDAYLVPSEGVAIPAPAPATQAPPASPAPNSPAAGAIVPEEAAGILQGLLAPRQPGPTRVPR